MESTKPWLRYVKASKVSDATLNLDGMKMRSEGGDDLGKAEGLVIDAMAGRTVYVVVDAGGWFKSKHFLAPIGYINVSPERDALRMALTKDQVSRFPGFDLDKFSELDEADFKRINDEIGEVCEPDLHPLAGEPYSAA